jgi:transposase
MQDTKLYEQILGLTSPWFVERIELKIAEGRVDIFVGHRPGAQFHCPVCEQPCGLHDHTTERVWRHLDSCQLQTLVHARVPRTGCMKDGAHKVKLPWAETRSRFTLLMERMIIDVVLQCSTISGASKIMRITWDEAFGVMQRAVMRGQARKIPTIVPYIGVDEKAFKKGHSYMTVVCDLDRATVEHVADDRTIESLGSYFTSLTEAQRQGIQAIAMDMWEPCVQATQTHLPLANIVFDRFHIMKHMNEAVDKVRLAEHRRISAWGCDKLKGTKHLWLYNEHNLPERHREKFNRLKRGHLQTARAWAIKETLRNLWDYGTPAWATRFFARWFGWASRSRLTPIQRSARMIRSRLANVVSYCKHKITNGVAEGINSKIMTIKRKCCGFANPENFKTAIYFHCGGLDLYPL